MDGLAAIEGDCTSGMCPERALWDSSDSFREWEPRNEGRTISRSFCLDDCERVRAAELGAGSPSLYARSEAPLVLVGPQVDPRDWPFIRRKKRVRDEDCTAGPPVSALPQG
jgi:hypothetical protein